MLTKLLFFSGDEIERVLHWQSGSDVRKLAGLRVRLRFIIRDADLYSLRFRWIRTRQVGSPSKGHRQGRLPVRLSRIPVCYGL